MKSFWENYKYQEGLERGLQLVPKKNVEDSRFEVPRVEANIEGNRTFFKNFKEITNLLNRKDTHVLKYLTSELGTNGNIEGSRVIFQGKHPKAMIQKTLDRYLQNYVFCPTCGKPDTKLEQSDRIRIMQCEACGANQAVRLIK